MRHITILVVLIFMTSCSSLFKKGKQKDEILEVTTNSGVFKLKLYDDTPIHKSNFLALVDSGFYDSLLFHRVIKDFMIQSGDPDSKNAAKGVALGNGGPGYTLEAEIRENHFHKKGVLAAARQGDNVNPDRRSSGSQFYIVTGRSFSKNNLAQMSASIDNNKKISYLQATLKQPEYKETMDYLQYCRNARLSFQYDSVIRSFDPMLNLYLDSVGRHEFTEEQIIAYSTVGGAPHLDAGYTVFGEIIEGMEVIDLIGNQKCDGRDRPMQDIIILGIKRVKN